jgi:DNA polymerase-3 subunit delta
MASLKPRDIEPFLKKPDFSRAVILLYGPDPGLVSERADILSEKSGVDLSDPFSLIRMDADDAASDVARIADEAHTIAMFGGKRLIRISGVTRKDLSKSVKPVLATPPEEAIILIESGDLKKSAGLRKQIETSPAGLAIPCYQDTDAAIEQLIDQELIEKNYRISRETRALLKSMLGDNRMVSRGELKKLALYCEGKDEITDQAIHEIVGDASKLVMDDVIDNTATGNPAQLQTVLPKALEAGNQPDIILLGVLRHFQMMQNARSRVELHRQNTSTVVSGMRPPVHFARKDAVSQAINIWSLDRLTRALTRIDKAMLECRQKAGISQALCSTTLLALSLEAAALKKR